MVNKVVKQKTAKHSEAAVPNRSFWNRFFLAAGVIFIAFFIYGVASLIAGPLIVQTIFGDVSDSKSVVVILGANIIVELLIAALFVAAAYFFRSNWRELGLGEMKNWTYLLLLPLIFIATLVLAGLANIIVSLVFPAYDSGTAQQLGLPPVSKSDDLVLTGLFLVVIVPIIEEFIFRGWLQSLLRRYASFWITMFIVSAIFASGHLFGANGGPLQWNATINVFFLALALSYLREKTDSIWTGIALHGLKNFVAFLLLFVFDIV